MFAGAIKTVPASLPLDQPMSADSQARFCDRLLNFRLFALAEENFEKLDRVMTYIHAFRRKVAASGEELTRTPPVLRLHESDLGKVYLNEVPCIQADNFFLNVLYFPFMPSTVYIYVWMSSSMATSHRNEHAQLFALAEEDSVLDLQYLHEYAKVEKAFLENIHGEGIARRLLKVIDAILTLSHLLQRLRPPTSNTTYALWTWKTISNCAVPVGTLS